MFKKQSQLIELRELIDLADRQLVSALAERFRTVKQIGVFKNDIGMQSFDDNRWKQIKEDRTRWAHELDLPIGLVVGIFELIHIYSLRIQEDEKNEKS